MTRVANTVPACLCNACECGRKPCPCPQMCVLPEQEAAPFMHPSDLMVAVGAVAAAAFLVWMEWHCMLPGGCGQ